jgi:hypothetical protein
VKGVERGMGILSWCGNETTTLEHLFVSGYLVLNIPYYFYIIIVYIIHIIKNFNFMHNPIIGLLYRWALNRVLAIQNN